MDYASRPLYFLNLTYILKLETVDLCSLVFLVSLVLSNARVSSVHIPIDIIIAVNSQLFETSCCFAIPGA